MAIVASGRPGERSPGSAHSPTAPPDRSQPSRRARRSTASAIYAHRHTIAYRLERIRDLTGFDPMRTEDRERLGLGLKAFRIIEPSLPK